VEEFLSLKPELKGMRVAEYSEDYAGIEKRVELTGKDWYITVARQLKQYGVGSVEFVDT
jgi:hypothetical protein